MKKQTIFSKIFQGSPYVENFGVYDEETVMRLLVFMDGYCRIFSIVSLQVQFFFYLPDTLFVFR